MLCESTSNACHGIKAKPRKKADSSATSFSGNCSDFLALPRIPGSIPTQFKRIEGGEGWARLALVLMDAKYIDEAAPQKSAPDLVAAGLRRMFSKHCAELAHIGFKITVTTGLENVLSTHRCRDDVNNDSLFALISCDGSWDGSELATVVERLEAKEPGLGESVLNRLEVAAARLSIPYKTPSAIRHLCAAHLWFWTDSQEEFLEAMQDHGYEEDEIEDRESFGPASFDRLFPEWVCKPSSRIKKARLKELQSQAGEVGVVSKSLCRLDSVLGRKFGYGSLDDVDAITAAFCGYPDWKPEDGMQRFLDDLDNAWAYDEYATDVSGYELIGSSQEEMRAWVKKTMQFFKAAQAFDELLGLIITPTR